MEIKFLPPLGKSFKVCTYDHWSYPFIKYGGDPMDSFSTHYGIKRLESKNAKNAIIQKLSSDFNLTLIIAEAFYQQFSLYFKENANISWLMV